jgi:hypothetical protein
VLQLSVIVRWLHRLGYRVVGLGAFLRDLREDRLPPDRAVVITIDDGYAETLSCAVPFGATVRSPPPGGRMGEYLAVGHVGSD